MAQELHFQNIHSICALTATLKPGFKSHLLTLIDNLVFLRCNGGLWKDSDFEGEEMAAHTELAYR